jgi:antitoxin (DNA-binding transcriptional repressor) of toxin-antitoxin stability system
MQTLQIRDAKAGFSAMVTAAENGRPTLVSRHGQLCAMLVPVEAGARLYPMEMPNLANYLLALPEAFDVFLGDSFQTERDTTPLRGVDFE